MARNVGKYISLLILGTMLWGCAGNFSSEDALKSIREQSEFEQPFCAPLTLGSELIGEEGAENPEQFVENKYGALLSKGLLTTDIAKANSWRTVLVVGLSDEGMKYYNKERSEKYKNETGVEEVSFVEVCQLTPKAITDIRTQNNGNVEVDYTIIESSVTPFGEYLGYSNGREHTHTRTFRKGTFSWELIPIN